MSVRRRSNIETHIYKRYITIADETLVFSILIHSKRHVLFCNILKLKITAWHCSKKTVVVTSLGDLATNIGEELLDISDKSPVVAIKFVKVWDFWGIAMWKLRWLLSSTDANKAHISHCWMSFVSGVYLSAMNRSLVMINPDVPEARKLRGWYTIVP